MSQFTIAANTGKTFSGQLQFELWDMNVCLYLINEYNKYIHKCMIMDKDEK